MLPTLRGLLNIWLESLCVAYLRPVAQPRVGHTLIEGDVMKPSVLIVLFMIVFVLLGTSYSGNIQSMNISPPDYADAKKTKEMISFFNELLKKRCPRNWDMSELLN